MPTKTLPANPSLAILKSQAKGLMQAHHSCDPVTFQRIREFHPRFQELEDSEIAHVPFKLSDAQLTIAREYGFGSWPRMKIVVEQRTQAQINLPAHERIDDPEFRRAVDFLDMGDVDALWRHLKDHPEIVRQRIVLEGGNYFRNPSLLEFCAENPTRQGTLPKNILDVVAVILEAGPDLLSINETLGLVVSGAVPRQCQVQSELIGLLCQYGADPTGALRVAVVHEEMDAVAALLNYGAKLDLSTAAALGRTDDFKRMLPKAGPKSRHRALAMAAQFGSVDCLKMLLETGEDPNRYNPKGYHSHATPLHQAAYQGYLEAVRCLIQGGANPDAKDVLFGGTPLGWAEHGSRSEVADYLRELPVRTT